MTPPTPQQARVIPSCRRLRLSLRPEVREILGAVAEKHQKPVGWVVRIAVERFLEPTGTRLVAAATGRDSTQRLAEE